MKSEVWPLSKLKNWDKNPRTIDKKDFERLKRQIKKHGVYKPLIIAPDGEILGGNMRFRALQALNHQEAWVSVVEPKSEAEKVEIALSDNDRAGAYDEDALAELIYGFKDAIALEDYKVDLKLPAGLNDLLSNYAPDTEKDDVVPEPRKTNIKLGDMFQLGEHRLLCGDSTKKEDVERLMAGEKADMVFTDPPYGMDLDTDYSDMVGIAGRVGNKFDKIIGDNIEYNPEHIFNFFSHCKEIFLWGGDYYSDRIPKRLAGSWIVWDKQGGGVGVNDPYDKMFGSNFELCWSKAKHKRCIARILWKGMFGMQNEDTKKRIHPTQKPIELGTWFLNKFSNKDNIIVDLFGGSGSTLIACEKLNRKCRMMEIDPVYCQVIVDRWEEFTGKKAQKID